MKNDEILGIVTRNHFETCISKHEFINITFEGYIEKRNKIIDEEMKKCKNEQDVEDAILRVHKRVLNELNKKLGISSYNQDFDELLLDSVTEIFCNSLRYDKDHIHSEVYYRGGGTSPMMVSETRLKPISTPCSRLHNWICRQKIQITKIFGNAEEVYDFNVKNIREVLNGQCEINLDVLLWMIALPLQLDSESFRMLAYEVLQDKVVETTLAIICALLEDNSPKYGKTPNPRTFIKYVTPPAEENRPTICIIGASGFIGSNLMKKIGNTYRMILHFHHLPTEAMLKNIPNDALIYVGDLENEELTKRIFLENNIDFVFWLAASSTQEASKDFLKAYDMNVDYLKCLFELLYSKIITLKGLLLPSTCLLYMHDKSGRAIYRETDNLMFDDFLPTYALTKLRLENFAKDVAKFGGVNITIARISQVYGSGDTSNRLIPSSVIKLSREEPLTCVTNRIGNSPCVNLIYIDDVVNAFISICKSAIRGEYDFDKYRIINLASEYTCSVLEVLDTLRKVFDKNVEIEKDVQQNLNTKIYTIDTSIAKNSVGFTPNISLEKGLAILKDNLS